MPIYQQRSSRPTTVAESLKAGAHSALTGFVNPHDRSGHVFYQSADGHIQEIAAIPGSHPTHTDLSHIASNPAHRGVSAPSATAGSALMSFVWPEENSGHVFYLGTDGHVHELYRVGTAAWDYSDLSAIPRTPPAPSPRAGSPLTGFTWQEGQTKTEHVFYIGADHHVHELKNPKGAAYAQSWRHTDLTTQVTPHAPNARADSPLTGFAWPGETLEHVFYFDTNGHIHELYRVEQGGRGQFDLTAMASATAHPARAGSPLTGFTWQAGQTLHVLYFGTDGHVHEMTRAKGTGAQSWRHTDLTTHPKSPGPNARADSALTSFVWSRDQSVHVFYVGTDHHIIELYKKANLDWNRGDDVTIQMTPHAPGARTGSALTGIAWHDDSEDVFYLDTNGHLHELWLHAPNESWQHGDVSESV